MSTHSYYYSRTALSAITEGLNKIFASLRRESGDVYVRSASSNMIVPVSSSALLDDLDELIDRLTILNPARFFVLLIDDSPADIKADIAARCQGLTASQHVCCEVVRLAAPPDRIAALPEVVRANLIPGMPTRLFLSDPAVDKAVIDLVAPICDQILFDSAEFEDHFEMLPHLINLSSDLIDMQWLAIGLWREQIKAAFQRPACQELLPALESIRISAQTSGQLPVRSNKSACLLLMAGWFIDKLNLEVFGSSPSGYDSYTPQGKIVKLSFAETPHPARSRLSLVELVFRRSPAETASVCLERSDKLEMRLKLAEEISGSTYFEDESKWGLIKRYFQIGEVFSEYNNALRNAVDLKLLRDDEG